MMDKYPLEDLGFKRKDSEEETRGLGRGCAEEKSKRADQQRKTQEDGEFGRQEERASEKKDEKTRNVRDGKKGET